MLLLYQGNRGYVAMGDNHRYGGMPLYLLKIDFKFYPMPNSHTNSCESLLQSQQVVVPIGVGDIVLTTYIQDLFYGFP